MLVSSIALAALAAAAAQSSGVKWVPLDQAQGRATKPAKAAAHEPTTAPAPPTPFAPPEVPTAVAAPPPQAAAAPVTDGSRPLVLTCVGGGTANKSTTAVGWGWGGWGMVAGHKDRGFNDQVDLRLFTGDDRIRIPRTMLPGLHGGDHGWFKVHDLVADARAIRLSAGVGMFNNPKVFIDRVTGTISISGKSGDYAGQCQVIDANAAPKF
jgi:hypothetical protein